MDLFNLGKVPWLESQLLYHALAYSEHEALVLLSPSTHYVCIGLHQEVEEEVDLGFCDANGIPVFRREIGGGAVYLNGDQYFFQLVLKKNNPLIPLEKDAFFETFLQPIINTYDRIGVPTRIKPVNDILAGSRKISGTGMAEIGDCVVFVGNVIMDFNYSMMSKVLKVPDEKFRDKVYQTLEENLTTIRNELGDTGRERWYETRLNEVLKTEFGKLLGDFEEKEIDESLKSKMNALSDRMTSLEWLHQRAHKRTGRQIKIRTGVNVVHKMHKAVGGLIRATYELRDNCRFGIVLSGDFFCSPANAVELLEAELEGVHILETRETLSRFYTNSRIETMGISVSDWMMVLQA